MDTIGILNARGTDGYTLQVEYADGSLGNTRGWYGSLQEAVREAIELAEPGDQIKNWTENWTDEEFEDAMAEAQ